MRTPPSDVRTSAPVASLRQKSIAALIDLAVFGVGMIILAGCLVAGAVVFGRTLGTGLPEAADADASRAGQAPAIGEDGPGQVRTKRARGVTKFLPASPVLRSRARLLRAATGAGAGLTIAMRNRRGPGYRAVGLRRVGARNGGPVPVSASVLGACFDSLVSAATRALFGGTADRRRDRLRELEPQLSQIRRRHGDDPVAQQRAITEVYEANTVHRWSGCGQSLCGHLLVHLLLCLGSRQGRTLRDRLTATTVIIDRH